MALTEISDWIAAAGAIGFASMGLVEALKVVTVPGTSRSLATIGLGKVRKQLGDAAMGALRLVYGPDAGSVLLEGAWREGPDKLAQTLRNGLRMAVFSEAPEGQQLIEAYGHEPGEVVPAIHSLHAGLAAETGSVGDAAAVDLAPAREKVARVEASIDARVDAAVAAGRDKYTASMQAIASVIAVLGSVLVFYVAPDGVKMTLREAVLAGLIAVPIAPVAKDLVAFLGSLRQSFQRTQGA